MHSKRGLEQASLWLCIVAVGVATLCAPAAGKPATYGSECDECVCGVRGRNNRIVGGSEANAHDYPWMVGIAFAGSLKCGGSLISHNYVLTAAHCTQYAEANELRIYFGGHNITADYTEQRRVRRIIAHTAFDVRTYDNDIALLLLDRPIRFGPKVQPGCLPAGSADTVDYAGTMGVVAGWGRLGEGLPTSPVLRAVAVPVWSTEQCAQSDYGAKRLTENMMCAGYHDGGRDGCQGDSGGPMHMESAGGSVEVIGLVSWGRGCARPNLPGLYTRVVNYMPWIRRQIGDECMCQPRQGVRSATNAVATLEGK